MNFRYNEKERLNWLKSIFPEFKDEPWHKNPVYHPEIDFMYGKFFKKEGEIKQMEIDTSKIIGIDYYPHYNGNPYRKPLEGMINWMDLFYSLVRLERIIDNFKSKEALINHIYTDNDKKHVNMYGCHYVTTSGQHRLCLAKLLGLKKVKVSVQKHRLNKQLFIRERLTKKNHKFYLTNKLMTGKYNINPSSSRYNEYLVLKIAGRVVSIHKDIQNEFIQYYNSFKNYQILSFLYSKKSPTNIRLINQAKDLKILKSLIIKHKMNIIKTDSIPTKIILDEYLF